MISILLLSNRAEPWKSSVLTATASNIYLNMATSILIQRPISSSWRSVDSDLIISTRKIANAHLNIAVTSRFSCKFWKITTCWHWNWHWNSIGSIAAVFDCLAHLEHLKHFRPVPTKLPENATKMLLKMFHSGTSFNQFLHFWSKNCNSTGNWHIFGPFGPIQLQINPIQNRLNAIFGSCWIWLDTLRPFSSFVVDSFWIQFRRGFENLKNGRRRSASKTSLSSFVGFPILSFNSVHFYRFCFVFIDIIVSFFFFLKHSPLVQRTRRTNQGQTSNWICNRLTMTSPAAFGNGFVNRMNRNIEKPTAQWKRRAAKRQFKTCNRLITASSTVSSTSTTNTDANGETPLKTDNNMEENTKCTAWWRHPPIELYRWRGGGGNMNKQLTI